MEIKKFQLIIIILIALFLRLYNLNYMEFKKDEATYLFKAVRMVEEGVIPITGNTASVGMNETPMFVYLLSLPSFFSKNPIVVTAYIAFLCVLAIFICFVYMKKMFGETAGLIAIAFYAVNPWSVFYSRKIWPNELLPLFVMFFIYFIYKAIYEKKKGYIILSLIVLGFIPQLHFSAIYFIIVFFGILLRYWQQINKKYLIIGCIFFALMFTPYATYQFKNNFIDIKKFKKLIDRENRFNQDAFSTILKLSTTNGFEASFGNDYGDFENQIFKINLLDDLQKFALFSAFVYFIVNYNSKLFILFLWLLFGMFSLIFAKVSMLNHYFIHLLPLIFILLGNLFSWMLKSRLKALRYGASVYIIVLLAYQFYFSLSFASYTRDHRCIQGDYGPPFYYRVADIKKAIGEGKKDFEAIHSTCKCVKCDPAATLYIVRYLN